MPPGPVQLSAKALLAFVSGPVLALPEVGRLPPQAPLALQLVALVDDQVSVALLPRSTALGFALSAIVGALGGGGALTITLTLWLDEPPAPVQVIANELFAAVNAPVLALPEIGRVPLQPPLAEQLVALVDDHVRVALLPLSTLLGLAANDTVGAGGGGALTATLVLWLAEPPAPVQVSVNVLLAAVSGPLLALPEVGRLPLQAPPATQDVVLIDDQVSVVLPPLSTLPGLAANDTVGDGGGAFTVTFVL